MRNEMVHGKCYIKFARDAVFGAGRDPAAPLRRLRVATKLNLPTRTCYCRTCPAPIPICSIMRTNRFDSGLLSLRSERHMAGVLEPPPARMIGKLSPCGPNRCPGVAAVEHDGLIEQRRTPSLVAFIFAKNSREVHLGSSIKLSCLIFASSGRGAWRRGGRRDARLHRTVRPEPERDHPRGIGCKAR